MSTVRLILPAQVRPEVNVLGSLLDPPGTYTLDTDGLLTVTTLEQG